MKRKLLGLIVLLAVADLLFTASCISMKMVSVDRKTQLENQILGSLGQLQKDLVLIASVRGEGLSPKKMPNAHREALIAMMNRQFNLDDIIELKQKQVVGEGNDGSLKIFKDVERLKRDSEFKNFVERIVKEENRDRNVIMLRVVAMNSDLADKDFPIVQKMMYRLNAQGSAPGTKIQNENGKWIEKEEAAEY